MSNNGKLGGLQFDPSTLSKMNRGKKDILKVAVQAPGIPTQLYEINQTLSLKENIRNFCKRWKVEDSESFAFQYFDTKLYITESTRDMMKNGDVLCLATAPEKIVADIMNVLSHSTTSEKRVKAFEQLAQCSSDPTFSAEFMDNHGIKWLVNIIENADKHPDVLPPVLVAFLELMTHGFASWDSILTDNFLKTIIDQVNKTTKTTDRVLQHCLGILELAVINSENYYNKIEKTLVIERLVGHLQRTNLIQQSAIALLNSLFLKAQIDPEKISSLSRIADVMAQKHFRTIVLNNVIRTPKQIESEMAHQLHVLQVLMFNTLEERMSQTSNSLTSQDFEKLYELRSIAFDSNDGKHHQVSPPGNIVDYKKLGFENYSDLKCNFYQTPPGLLALDVMIYFARNQQDNYIRMILENSSRREDKHVCPFAKSSIEITKRLCEILKIGEQPTEIGEEFHPMFFAHDHAFEEFFCICILLLNKTWKEMSAIMDDFEKVVAVVQDQIVLALKQQPPSLDAFKQKLLPYSEILKIRQQELIDKEEFDSQATPVVELQVEVKPYILDLIKHQRLAFLKEGTVFSSLQKKRTKWFCRLSYDMKALHYGDIDDSEKSYGVDVLPNKILVHDIKELVIGKSCPHVKNARAQKSIANDLAFTIVHNQDKMLNVIALDKDVWSMWVDGINGLLGKKMTSPKAKTDMEMLLNMEMKLRLLDLENVPIPDQPPAVPSLPSNYNFAGAA